MATANLILGDCIEKMHELPEASVDCIITDPPYGLEFMGKDWDGFGDNEKFEQFNKAWATEAFRVLKTGGFMFAMGGTRTHHRLTCGIEDAGFMVRDELCWVYMQGFPKAQDLGKLIDQKLGLTREKRNASGDVEQGIVDFGFKATDRCNICGKQYFSGSPCKCPKPDMECLSEQAKSWQGWKTPALKPAFEPIVVAQKPVEDSITENVMKYGVGGYNIDECRIAFRDKDDKQGAVWGHQTGGITSFENIGAQGEWGVLASEKGRYPSNLLMQEECFGKLSKFFLIPKASKGEKEENLDEWEEQTKWLRGGGGVGIKERENLTAKNIHPTVKPIALMQHLIKLTTKPLYTILDPFLGSGTTAVAALNLNRNVIGIEISEEYMKIAKARIAEEAKQTRLV